MAKAKKKDIEDISESNLPETDAAEAKAVPVDDAVVKEDKKDLPENMPLMPLRDIVAFPDMVLPLFVGRDKSIKAIEEAANKDGIVFLSVQKSSDEENPNAENIYEFGTV